MKSLSKAQAAAKLDRSEKTVERLIASGKLRATKIEGRCKILDADIEAYVHQLAADGSGVHAA